MIVLFAATAFSLWRNFTVYLAKNTAEIHGIHETADLLKGISLGWIWSAYNLLMLGIALLILMDVPKPDIYEWFNLRRVVQLKAGDRTFWGITTAISESGAEVALTQMPSWATENSQIEDSFSTTKIARECGDRRSYLPNQIAENVASIATKSRRSIALSIRELGTEASYIGGAIYCEAATLKIVEEGCLIPVAKIEIVRDKCQLESDFKAAGKLSFAQLPTVRIAFDRLNISQHRRLIEMLYCRPGQWLSQETPGEWKSLWLLLKIAFKPRSIFERNRRERPIEVGQF